MNLNDADFLIFLFTFIFCCLYILPTKFGDSARNVIGQKAVGNDRRLVSIMPNVRLTALEGREEEPFKDL